MMNNSSFNISSMSKMFVGAAVISAVTYASFALISDGDLSSDDINKIFDEALQENAETVIELCEENLNETTVAQGLQIISGLNITVDNNLVAKVKERCGEILSSTTTTTLTPTTIPVEKTMPVEPTMPVETTIPVEKLQLRLFRAQSVMSPYLKL